MKKCLFTCSTLICFALLQPVFAQQVLVLDLVVGEPIANAEVYVYFNKTKTVKFSNTVGIVKIDNLNLLDSVVCKHTSYESISISRKALAKSNYVIAMTSTTSLLPGIVIRGIPDSEEIDEPPMKIDRIRSAEVKFQNPQTAADVIGLNNRIYVQKSQMGGGSPMIRGFAANNVLIVVDGVRMNNAIFRDGNVQNIITIDANLVDETEVFYGPGSVIYGSDAMGGVMAFQTKIPTIDSGKHYKGNVMLRTSTANKENSWHVDFEYGKNKVAGLSSISLANYSNLKMGNNGPDAYTRPIFNEFNGTNDSVIYNDNKNVQYFTGYSQININQKFRYKPNNKHDLIFHAGYTTSSPIPRYDRLIQLKNNQLRYGDWFYGPQKWAQLNARYKRDFEKSVFANKMVVTAAFQQFEESRHERLFNSRYLDSRIENVNAYTLNADFDVKKGKSDILYGFEGVYNTVKSTAYSLQIDTGIKRSIATRYPDGSDWYNMGIYVSGRREINKKTNLSLGMRYSIMGLKAPFTNAFYAFPFQEIEMQKSALNGSLGLKYEIKKNHLVYVNLSSGFRAPNIDDVGKIFDSEPGFVIVPNQGLLPEYSYSGEMGLTSSFNQSFDFSLNLFYTSIQNLVVRDNFTLNGQDSLLYGGSMLKIQSLVNSGIGRIMGSEIQVRYRINHFLKLTSSFNFITGETADGQAIRHVTPNFGNTALDLRYRRFQAQLYASYNMELSFNKMAQTEQNKAYLYIPDNNGKPYAPAWFTLNLKTGFYVSSALKVNVGLENILDKRYRMYGSGITAPGRNLILSINGRF